jgi:hypothetical protein
MTDSDILRAWNQAMQHAGIPQAQGLDLRHIGALRTFIALVVTPVNPAPAIVPDCTSCGTVCQIEDIPRCGTPEHHWTPRVTQERTCETCTHIDVPHHQEPCVHCYDPETGNWQPVRWQQRTPA